MISIQESVSELDRSHRLWQTTFDCYVAAIRDVASYAIDLEEATTGPYRESLETLAAGVTLAGPAGMAESRSTLRGLLRDYRGKAVRFINDLREELASRARALEEILKSLTQSDGDHEVRLRGALQRLREVSCSPAGAAIRDVTLAAADSIGQSVDELRKQHDLSIAQFQMEIRILHKRIDALEMTAMIDSLSQLFTRAEMEERIRTASAEWYVLLLIRAGGLRTAETHFGAAAAAELAAAFGKRLRNCVPPDAVLGRWGPEEFVAQVALAKREAFLASKRIAENLSGPYACLKDGKTVRPTLQVSVAVVDREAGEPPRRTCARIAGFFKTSG